MVPIKQVFQNNFRLPTLDTPIVDLINLIDEFQLSHLPIFENKNLMGMVNYEALLSLEETETIKNNRNLLEHFFLSDETSIFDIIQCMDRFQSNLVPIIDFEENYLGYVTQKSVIHLLAKNYFISEPSVTILVSIGIKQYSFSEVSKIIESNNGHISAILVTQIELNRVEICVKFNAINLSSVGETFERFGYTIEQKFFNDHKKELLKDRYQNLLHYLSY
jgi:CBS domain-containing protein